MKVHSATAAIWLLLQFSITGCGLGTEVGNGLKPGTEDEDSKKTSASEKTSPMEQEDAINSDGETAGNMPEDDDVISDEPGAYDFDINILLNSCGSPFESGYNGKINLTSKNNQGKFNFISGEYNKPTGTWTLKNSFGKFLATISDDNTPDDRIVEVLDANQVPIDSGYVCSQQTGSSENNIYTYNFELTKYEKSATLSWNVEDNGIEEKLISISIRPVSSESGVIKFEASK